MTERNANKLALELVLGSSIILSKATFDCVLMKMFENHLYGAGIFLRILRYILRLTLILHAYTASPKLYLNGLT